MILRDGDIISIDTGAVVDGWVGDNAWTFFVGTPTPEAKALCEVTRDCLKAAIEQAVPGNHIGDVGYAVQSLPSLTVTACFVIMWVMALAA